MDAVPFLLTKSKRRITSEPPLRVGWDRAAPNKRLRTHFRAIRWLQVPPPQPYSEAKKDIMASNPRNLTISGVFLAFARFFATMRFADTECRKKDIISKKRLRTGFEQLSPAAKAQYPFLRAESATFRVAKAFCAPSALFSYFYLLNICVCLKGGSSSVTFIKRKIATAASTTG